MGFVFSRSRSTPIWPSCWISMCLWMREVRLCLVTCCWSWAERKPSSFDVPVTRLVSSCNDLFCKNLRWKKFKKVFLKIIFSKNYFSKITCSMWEFFFENNLFHVKTNSFEKIIFRKLWEIQNERHKFIAGWMNSGEVILYCFSQT